jgi:hypothetical protein
MRDRDDEHVPAAGHRGRARAGRQRRAVVRARRHELALGQRDVALGADGDDEVLCERRVRETEPALARPVLARRRELPAPAPALVPVPARALAHQRTVVDQVRVGRARAAYVARRRLAAARVADRVPRRAVAHEVAGLRRAVRQLAGSGGTVKRGGHARRCKCGTHSPRAASGAPDSR